MNITVLYFASLADTAKLSQETMSLDNDTNLTSLYEQLQTKHGFNLDKSQLRVAINDEFADWDSALNDGDMIAFIPPVAGG